MNAPITEAQYQLAHQIRQSSTQESAARLIANSEAQAVANLQCVFATVAVERTELRAERDQLRAEVERLTASCEFADFQRQQARAELAFSLLAELHKSFAGNVHTDNTKLRAELAAERARVDWLEDHGWPTGEPCTRAAIDAAMATDASAA